MHVLDCSMELSDKGSDFIFFSIFSASTVRKCACRTLILAETSVRRACPIKNQNTATKAKTQQPNTTVTEIIFALNSRAARALSSFKTLLLFTSCRRRGLAINLARSYAAFLSKKFKSASLLQTTLIKTY